MTSGNSLITSTTLKRSILDFFFWIFFVISGDSQEKDVLTCGFLHSLGSDATHFGGIDEGMKMVVVDGKEEEVWAD